MRAVQYGAKQINAGLTVSNEPNKKLFVAEDSFDARGHGLMFVEDFHSAFYRSAHNLFHAVEQVFLKIYL